MSRKSDRRLTKKLTKLLAKFARANPEKSPEEVHKLVKQHLIDTAAVRAVSRLKRIKMKKGKKTALCPQCRERLAANLDEFLAHFSMKHSRVPSEGELRQFASGGPNGNYQVSDFDWHKPKVELSGGGVSPR